jgi:hypothetical protein
MIHGGLVARLPASHALFPLLQLRCGPLFAGSFVKVTALLTKVLCLPRSPVAPVLVGLKGFHSFEGSPGTSGYHRQASVQKVGPEAAVYESKDRTSVDPLRS